MAEDVIIPQMGESITEGILAQWLVSEGQYVNEGDSLFELETDKVSTEVPAPCSGAVSLKAEEGAVVDIGAVVAAIDTTATAPSAEATTPEKASAPEEVQTPPAATTPAPISSPAHSTANTDSMPIGPAARKLINEHNLDPTQITATGKKGALTKDDVRTYIATRAATVAPAAITAVAAPIPSSVSRSATSPVTNTKNGENNGETRKRMSGLRQRIATRLVQSQHTAAILSTFNEIDMFNAMALRTRFKDEFAEKHGVKLGFMSFFAKACIEALKKYPLINSYIDGTDVVTPDGIHMSIAVGTPKGLVVPVVRNAENMSFADIERTIRAVAVKARDGKLTVDDMNGGSFTITNGGVYGSLLSTPILNPPQSGILGMHAIKDRPIALNGEVVIRPMMYTALSYDHRIVDGSEAVGFLVRIKELIEDPERLIFDL